MDPLTLGLIGGGASLLGSVFSSTTSAANTQAQIAAQEQMQKETEAFNAQQADINRGFQAQQVVGQENFQAGQVAAQDAFQLQNSNTAYQRASADMKAAGLNPMMMFGSGGAASTPSGSAASGSSASGSTASVGTPTVPLSQNRGVLAGVGEAVSKGIDAAVTAKTMDQLTQQIANMRTQQELTAAQTATEQEKPALVRADTSATEQTAEVKKQDVIRGRPSTVEALGVGELPASTARTVGKLKYLTGSVGDIAAPIVSSAVGAGRIGQAFSDIANSQLRRSMERGNFIGKYGVPIEEYLKP